MEVFLKEHFAKTRTFHTNPCIYISLRLAYFPTA